MSIFGPGTLKNRLLASCVGGILVLPTAILIYLMAIRPAKNPEERIVRLQLDELFPIILAFAVLAVLWSFSKTTRVDPIIAFPREKLKIVFILLLGIPLIFAIVAGFFRRSIFAPP